MGQVMDTFNGLGGKLQIPGIGVKATGTAFPEQYGRWFTNEDIHRLRFGSRWATAFQEKGKDPDYYYKQYGFQKRFWVHTPGDSLASKSATSVDLMEAAAQQALESASIPADGIDLVIAFTTTSPRYTSSVATILTGRLGMRCAAFEMKSGCSSAIYAMVIAYQFLASGAGNVMIVGGDTLSKVTDLSSSHLYAAGDGAAALILGKVTEQPRGLNSFYLDSDGSYSESMGVPGILPPPSGPVDEKEYLLKIDTRSESRIEELWKSLPGQLYEVSGMDSTLIDFLLPHQVNRRLIEITAKSARIEQSRVIDMVGGYANFGPAGILNALHQSLHENRLKPGDRLMWIAVGGGLARGGLILTI